MSGVTRESGRSSAQAVATGGAAFGLRAELSGRPAPVDQAEVGQLGESLGELREERARREGAHDGVRRVSSQLLGDLVRDRLGALDGEGMEIALEEPPRKERLELCLQPPAVVVATPDLEDVRAIGCGRKRGSPGSRGREDDCLEARRGTGRRQCLAEIAGRGAAEGLQPECLRGGDRARRQPVLEGVGRIRRLELQMEVDSQRLGDRRSGDERGPARYGTVAPVREQRPVPPHGGPVEEAGRLVPVVVHVERPGADRAAREGSERLRLLADPATQRRPGHPALTRAPRRRRLAAKVGTGRLTPPPLRKALVGWAGVESRLARLRAHDRKAVENRYEHAQAHRP